MSETELKYEVLRWTKINPKPVTEDLLTYLERAAEFFYDCGMQDGYLDGVKDGERTARDAIYGDPATQKLDELTLRNE